MTMTVGEIRKLHDVVDAIRVSVQKHGRARFTQELKPERAALDSIMPSNEVALSHVLWMCGETDNYIDEFRVGKANRWIGFMQGILWIAGVASIDESRKVNA